MPLPIITGAQPVNPQYVTDYDTELVNAISEAISAIPAPVVNVDMKPSEGLLRSIVDEIRKLILPQTVKKPVQVDWYFEIKRGGDKLITDVIARSVEKA